MLGLMFRLEVWFFDVLFSCEFELFLILLVACYTVILVILILVGLLVVFARRGG